MDESARMQIEDLKEEIRVLTRALEVARELIPADAARNQEALEWIARQFCDRTDDVDKYVCMESEDCITEYCLSCYARAVLRAQEDDER